MVKKMKKNLILMSLVAIPLLVGCGSGEIEDYIPGDISEDTSIGQDDPTNDTVDTTGNIEMSSLSGDITYYLTQEETAAAAEALVLGEPAEAMPETRVEVFCENNYYFKEYVVENIPTVEGTVPTYSYNISAPQDSACRLVFTTSELDPEQRIITNVSFSITEDNAFVTNDTEVNFSTIELDRSYDSFKDFDGNHIYNSNILINLIDTETLYSTDSGISPYDYNGDGVLDFYEDTDGDLIVDAYEDDNNNGIYNLLEDFDADGVSDMVESVIERDVQDRINDTFENL